MILKRADDRSNDIAQLESLLSAAPDHLHDRIKSQIANIRTGSAGERDAAHFLDREFGSSSRTAILHDLRLELNGGVAQIDHLVIHRVQATAWVLETKNYAGRLTCDEHGDWTVWYGNKPRSIPSPVNQARRQCELLRQWLAVHNISSIHKIEPVVLISPSSSIDRSKLAAGNHVVKSDNFGEWWRKQSATIGLGTALRMIGKYALSGMSEEDLAHLGTMLAAAHQPAAYDWRSRLGLAHSAVLDTVSQSAPTRLSGLGPWAVDTPHGQVTISRIPDGRYAIRNERSDALIAAVKQACTGRGRWNPRYRNWLVEEAELDAVLQAIIGDRA